MGDLAGAPAGGVDEHADTCYMPRAVGGLIQPTWCSASFVDVMRQLPEDFAPADYCRPDLLLHSEGRLAVYFTPFDRVNPDAKLVLVGLTPGRAQAHLALTTAAAALRHGTNLNEALDEAHRVGSFAGAMRSNMTSMFDGIGLHTALGLDSCSRLFTDRRDLLGGTSAVLYPVFIDGKNYSGSPTILRSPILRAFASQVLAAELDRTPNALIIPLGQAAADGVLLAGVEPGRVLDGFPHPSGAKRSPSMGLPATPRAADRDRPRMVVPLTPNRGDPAGYWWDESPGDRAMITAVPSRDPSVTQDHNVNLSATGYPDR